MAINAMTDRRTSKRHRAASVVLGAAFLATSSVTSACGSLSDPMVRSGACTLQVEQEDAEGGRHALTPPFVVSLAHAKGRLLVLHGQGWAHVRFTAIDGAGTLREDDVVGGEALANGRAKWWPDGEGVWTLRLADDVNGCVRQFSIEARPAAPSS
jgi:hypothetical protein